MTTLKSKKVVLLMVTATVVGFVTGSSIDAASIQYKYDAVGRLIKVIYPDGQATSYTYDTRGNLLSRTTAPEPQVTLHDWNGDGIVSIVGDVPPFVDCVYFLNCPSGVDVIAVGDCNDDGILSIIGDVPCFVDCVYFGNCPD